MKVRILDIGDYKGYNFNSKVGDIVKARDCNGIGYECLCSYGVTQGWLFFPYKNAELIAETPQTDSIVESVINQFKQRSEVGINKYGTTLDRNDLSTLEWIKEAQQEAMDFCLYLEKLHKELAKNQ